MTGGVAFADQRATGRGLHGAFHAGPPGGVKHPERAEHVHVEVRRRVGDDMMTEPAAARCTTASTPAERGVERVRVTDVALHQLGV